MFSDGPQIPLDPAGRPNIGGIPWTVGQAVLSLSAYAYQKAVSLVLAEPLNPNRCALRGGCQPFVVRCPRAVLGAALAGPERELMPMMPEPSPVPPWAGWRPRGTPSPPLPFRSCPPPVLNV